MGKLDGTRLNRGTKGEIGWVLDSAVALHTRERTTTHETLVTLRVVVLETDLELDGLDEVTLLTDSGSLSLEGRLVEDGLDHGSHA